MNKETAQSLFLDYLYDELEKTQKNELERYLSKNPKLQKELDELSEVRAMLSHLPVQNPEEQLVLIEPEANTFMNWWDNFIKAITPQTFIIRTGLVLTAFLLIVMITAAFFSMDMTFRDGGFSIAFGEQEPLEQAFSAEQVEYLISQVKAENALLMAQFVEAAQQQQDQKIEQAFTSFAHYMNQQRTSDLQLISSDLSSLEETYYDRFRQTDQVLGEIIQTVSTRN